MQLCNRIYYSTVHWRLNMFRAAHRSSSGALTVFAVSGLYTHVVTDRCQEFPLRLNYGRSPHAYVNQRLQIQLELLMMSGMPLETCWAFNERWNNQFYYKIASCWLFLLRQTWRFYDHSNEKWEFRKMQGISSLAETLLASQQEVSVPCSFCSYTQRENLSTAPRQQLK